jgi:Protein of unknown function (DUF1349)
VKRLTWLCCLAAGAALAAPVPPPRETPFTQPAWGNLIDPDKDCTFTFKRDALTLKVPGGERDLCKARRRWNAPRLLRDVEGDFLAEVRVAGAFRSSEEAPTPGDRPGVSAGLLVIDEKRKWHVHVGLGASCQEKGESDLFAEFAGVDEEKFIEMNLEEEEEGWPLPPGAKGAVLRLERRGKHFTGSLSADGRTWHAFDRIAVALPKKVKVGVAAFSNSKDSFTVTFDRFKLKPKGK